MAEKKIKIEELIQDDKNFNRGTERGQELINKSFRELGAGRSILLDKDNRIIAGNKSQLGAIEAGIENVRIIETDGKELIAVKRTDISLDSKEGRELALADNATTDANLEWDKEQLEAAQADFNIMPEDWGIELGGAENNTPKDMSADFQFEYKVEIQCATEREQEQIYNEMKERGYECRILTL